MALFPDALVGGLAGAIFTQTFTLVRQHFLDKKAERDEISSISRALIQDIDALIESFESLYADASDLVERKLEIKLRVFKYIEPTSFANRYKVEKNLPEEDFAKLSGIQYGLKEIRESSEALILDPPGEPAKEHWSEVQNFLAELTQMRTKLRTLVKER